MSKELRITKSIALFLFGIILTACTASDDEPVNTENKASSSYDTHVGIYDTLSIPGTFVSTIAQYKVVLENQSNQKFEFDLIESSTSEIKVFIPKDFTPEKYSVLLKKSGTTTALGDAFSDAVEVYVRKRPIILSASATTFKKGAAIVLNGENFLNTSGNDSYKPEIWIMALGYTNTVNTVSLNTAGTVANVTVSTNLNPGKYKLYLLSGNGPQDSYDAWSNPVYITVIP